MIWKKAFAKFIQKITSNLPKEDLNLSDAQQQDFARRHIEVLAPARISEDTIIGSYTYIGTNTNITKSRIGNYCSIANNVSIGNGEHLIDTISSSSLFYDPHEAYDILTKGECIIGHDVWIGVDTIIRRGVKIGNGAVIGANSFVNKDVPNFAIVAGSPAKILRFRFNESQRQVIEQSSWWDYSLEEARIKVKELQKQIASLKE